MVGDIKIRRVFFFQAYECTAVEEYLEEMANKGWMLEEVEGYYFIFFKIKPQRIKFAVDIFNPNSQNKKDIISQKLEYVDYCQAAGWELICESKKNIMFYYSLENNPTSIQTDAKLKLKAIFKATVTPFLAWFFVAGMFVLSLYNHLYRGFDSFITDYTNILMVLMQIFVGILLLSYFVDGGLWFVISYRRISKGLDIIYHNKKFVKRLNFFRIGLVGIIGTLYIVNFVLPAILSKENNFGRIILGGLSLIFIILLVKYKFYSGQVNYAKKFDRIYSLIFGKLGLYLFAVIAFVWIFAGMLSDIPGHKEMHKIDNSLELTYGRKTIFAEMNDYSGKYVIDNSGTKLDMDFSVFESPYQWVLNRYLHNVSDDRYNLKAINDSRFGAKKVYKDNKYDQIVAVYDTKIVSFNLDSKYEKEEISFIKEKLKID